MSFSPQNFNMSQRLAFFFFLPKLSSWQDNKGAVRLHFESFLRFALRLR